MFNKIYEGGKQKDSNVLYYQDFVDPDVEYRKPPPKHMGALKGTIGIIT
jgi:hypothetical protein